MSRWCWAHIQAKITGGHRAFRRVYIKHDKTCSIVFSFKNMFQVSHSRSSLKQEGGHWAFFYALNRDAMALPHGDYNRVQISIDICASAAPTDNPWTVEHLLHHFHMDVYQCEVNDLIFPMMSEPGRHLMPAMKPWNSIGRAGTSLWYPIDVFTGPFVKENCFGTWQMHHSWQITSAHWVRLTFNPLTSMLAWSSIFFPQWH